MKSVLKVIELNPGIENISIFIISIKIIYKKYITYFYFFKIKIFPVLL